MLRGIPSRTYPPPAAFAAAGIAVISLLTGVARSAVRPRHDTRPPLRADLEHR